MAVRDATGGPRGDQSDTSGHRWVMAALIHIDDEDAATAHTHGHLHLSMGIRVQAADVYCEACLHSYEDVYDQPCTPQSTAVCGPGTRPPLGGDPVDVPLRLSGRGLATAMPVRGEHCHEWVMATLILLCDKAAATADLRGSLYLGKRSQVRAAGVYCEHCRRDYAEVGNRRCAVESRVMRGGPGTRRTTPPESATPLPAPMSSGALTLASGAC